MSEKRLGPKQRALLAKLDRGGQAVMRTFHERGAFFALTDGEVLDAASVVSLIKRGLLVPRDPGLMDGIPQTFVRAA